MYLSKLNFAYGLNANGINLNVIWMFSTYQKLNESVDELNVNYVIDTIRNAFASGNGPAIPKRNNICFRILKCASNQSTKKWSQHLNLTFGTCCYVTAYLVRLRCLHWILKTYHHVRVPLAIRRAKCKHFEVIWGLLNLICYS